MTDLKNIEESIIGTLLIYQDLIEEVVAKFSPDIFTDNGCKIMYSSILDIHKSGKKPDMLNLTMYLNSKKLLASAGGAARISSTTSTVSPNTLMTNLLVLKENKIKSDMIAACQEHIKKVIDGEDIFKSIDALNKSIENITSFSSDIAEKDTDIIFNEFEEMAKQGLLLREQNKTLGVPTSLSAVNAYINGWQKGTLNVLAARPAMGKTAFTKCCIDGAVAQDIPVGMLSLEVSSSDLVARIVSEYHKLSIKELKNGRALQSNPSLSFADVRKKYKKQDGTPLLFIDDSSGVNIQNLIVKIRRMYKKGCRLIIIDYLQIMDKEGKNEHQELGTITRKLKSIARELDIPILLLSQLSRNVEQRPDKKPQMSDLRGSGSIEEDADIVMFLMRPEYYGIERIQHDNQELEARGLGILTVAKNRAGETADVLLRWDGMTTSYRNFKDDVSYVPEYDVNARIEPNQNFDRQKEPDSLPF